MQHDFQPGDGGQYPLANLVKASDGNYYGCTQYGGTSGFYTNSGGTIFRMTPAGVVTVLVNFAQNDARGSRPQGLIQGADGNFYGVCQEGGADYYGTIFKMTSAGVVTVLHSFSGGSTDGKYSDTGIMQASDGNLYGTVTYGGPDNDGVVFKCTTSGTETLLHTFSGTDGEQPECVLAQASDGNLYGTTFSGSTSTTSGGIIFKISTGGTFSTVHDMVSSTDGGIQLGGVIVGSDGNLYGTNGYYGTNGHGNVYQCSTSGTFKIIHSFDGTDGDLPWGSLAQASNGDLYGTTYDGGANGFGTLFQVTTAGAFTSLHSFGNTDGWYPKANVIVGFDGQVYGTTTAGDTNAGTVFKSTTAGTFTQLHAFTFADAAQAASALVQGPDGSFYGTSVWGGVCGYGSVYKIALDGTVTILHSFNQADGAEPYDALVFGNDGCLYGTTSTSGPSTSTVDSWGTAFKITTTGTFTLLHSFGFTSSTDAKEVYTALTLGTDGNFYGVSPDGGANGDGTVFKMTPTGTVTVLHSCTTATTDVEYLNSPLVQASDGNFYGLAAYGGANGVGGLFEETLSGTTFTLNHSFSTTDGAYPEGKLVQGADGRLYGASLGDSGTTNYGTLFAVTTAGALTKLYTFTSLDVYGVFSGLVKGSDGNFYGKTEYGGSGGGILFRITPAGAFTTLVNLRGTYDYYTEAWLVQASDGTFYMTDSTGGVSGQGQVFRLVLDTNPHNVVVMQSNTTGDLQIWNVWDSTVITTDNLSMSPGTAWQVVGYADFNGDGYPDILFQNKTSGWVAVWYMRGANYVSGGGFNIQTTLAEKVVGVGDFGSADGYPDVLVENTSTTQLSVWHVVNGTVQSRTVISNIAGTSWNVLGAGDFNDDGNSDILYQNNVNRKMAVWYMDGATFSSGGGFTTTPSAVLSYNAIVDLDGYPDLVYQTGLGVAPEVTRLSSGTSWTLPAPTSDMGIVGPR